MSFASYHPTMEDRSLLTEALQRLVKSAPTLTSSAFEDGELKIFRNTTTKDLRFHCRVGTHSEAFWSK